MAAYKGAVAGSEEGPDLEGVMNFDGGLHRKASRSFFFEKRTKKLLTIKNE
jgi:hypothetical protein